MRRFPLLPRVCLLCLFLISPSSESLARPTFVGGGWDDIPEAELAATAPKIDPDAACEFLYRRLKVDDAEASRTTFSYHNRAKIYTEAGVEAWSKIDIDYQTGWYIRDLRARVIYPDGATAQLANKDIHKRQIYKNDRFEGHAKSFSFPGLKPGCIIEYKWSEVRKYWMPGLELPLRAEWPTWEFEAYIKPYRGLAASMRLYHTDATWDKKLGGFLVNVKDQPAISDKPLLAARKDFEPFVSLGYAQEIKVFDADKYWGYRGGSLVDLNRDFIKAKDREVKRVADEIFEGVQFNDDKLRAAYDYCVSKIVNIDEFTEVYTEQEIEELKENSRPSQTIKNGYGTRYDINAVFASLAAAAGFSAHLAQVEDHREFTFHEKVTGSFNLANWVVAIRQGPGWRYFDPGSSFLPFETINPNNANGNVIVTDKKYYYMEKTPPAKVEDSQASRIATASIDDYGDLEAKVLLQYKGYSGLWRKRMFASMTEKEIEKYVLDEDWTKRLPRAAISDFKVRHRESRDEPLELSFTLKVPGYADVLGDRLIFNPCLFENGAVSPFLDDERVEPVAFDFLPLVIDRVVFTLPEGYLAEDQLATHDKFDGAVVSRRSMMERNLETNEQTYQRMYLVKERRIGGHFYQQLKREFDQLVESDSRPVSFSRVVASSN